MSYRLLVLDPRSRSMSLPVLRALHRLVEQGAVVAGQKPTTTPSLADDLAEFDRLSNEIFGSGTAVHSFGKGRVYAGSTAEAALRDLNVAPDCNYFNTGSDQTIAFLHRKLTEGNLYFVDSRSGKDATFDASFRVAGRVPELWYADTGKTAPASFSVKCANNCALKSGTNQISITVINSSVNRLIGDLQPDATTKYTFSTWPAYKKDSPLVPSGLLGPVAIWQDNPR